VVAVLHLLPSSSSEIAILREHNGQKTRAQIRYDGFGEKTGSTTTTKLVVKGFRDEELFTNEVEAYKRMLSNQGTIVPEYYGSNQQVSVPDPNSPSDIERLPCVVMEYIAGEDLFDYKIAHRNKLPMLAKAVEDCCVKVAETGVAQMDPQLEGMIVVDAGFAVKMIDFSDVRFDPYYNEGMSRASSHFLMRRYAEVLGWEMPMDVTTWATYEAENNSGPSVQAVSV
jgi:hypothetical protein